MQFFDSTGAPLVSGTLSTYVAGTSTPLATYTDSTGLIANSVVITLNTRGEAAVWLGSTDIYKFVLKDAAGVLIWTADNIEGQVGLADLTNNTDATKGSALVGYLPAGASAVGTNVQTKLRQTMSVDDFGAVGNGSTNDYQAIANAQNALVAAGGGTLLFTQGKTYSIGTVIPMKTGVTYKGGGRGNISAGSPEGAKIVSSSSAIFTNTTNLTIAGVTFDGLTLESSLGGGHIFDWSLAGIPNPGGVEAVIAKVEIKNCIMRQYNAAKSVISSIGLDNSTGVLSLWLHDSEYEYAAGNTVPAIHIRQFTVNGVVIEKVWSTCAALAATGNYSIFIEGTNPAGAAFENVVRQVTFEFAIGGCVALLSNVHSGIEQCASYDISTYPLANAAFYISKGTGPASAMCWVKACRSTNGVSVTYPDMRLDMATAGEGLFSVSECQFNWFDGVGASNPGVSFRGNTIAFFSNASFMSLSEGINRDLFFSTTDSGAKSFSISNGNAGTNPGYLSFQVGAPITANVLPVSLTYMGSFGPLGTFQWGGTTTVPLMYVTSGGQTYAATFIPKRQTVTVSLGVYGINNGNYQSFTLQIPNATAFSIANPTYVYDGQIITINVCNFHSSALGAVTWGALYKMAAWTSPATGQNRSITFLCDGTNFVEISRTTADVPN
jgi:hypothetical protein